MAPMTHEEKLIYAAAFAAETIRGYYPAFTANHAVQTYRKHLQVILAGEPQTEEDRTLLNFAGIPGQPVTP
jgi:hypothetical protein